MKGRKIQSFVTALAVAAAFAPLSTALGAQNSGTLQPPNAQQKQVQQKVRTYYGTIVKIREGGYALMIDPVNQRGYNLDDQKDAKKFDKKKVLVKGKLNKQTGMLHVMSIKPVAN
ncbi:MAG: hypothetical protein P8Z30_20640 [Acidobacteriota bacterium]